ncbi:MAG: phenylalanine--tRNA ligase subunit beta [Candidatus Kerfeldbacteria bacterium]|nr:phenylalanine--tRNA ligase subunit beta [Candidatus Kerfeldbacteria bacterium]
MKFSYSWLQEFAPQLPSTEKIMAELTTHSVEVEGIESGAAYSGVVVGRIEHVEKHPNADRLSVCRVNIGSSVERIVCGGVNLSEGMDVAVATVGARVRWHGEGEPITLEAATIRGVESRGMICSSDELDLSAEFPKKEEREILNLTHLNIAVGTPLAQALGNNDALIDIDNKSMTHRPDLFSHVGMAREMAAVFGVPFVYATSQAIPTGLGKLDIQIDKATGCRRYIGIELNVAVGNTPVHIQQRLQACGIKSINNVVDITNYVMLELGQPLHAFDADRVTGGKIVVRNARVGEKMHTLDKEEKLLDESVVVIADTQQPIAVAGVIGGLDSGVTAQTKRIILEIANFEPVRVRQAAVKLGTRTESALRFEKNPSAELCTVAAARTVELLQQHAAGEVVAYTDLYPQQEQLKTITLTAEDVERLAGVAIPMKDIQELLQRLECQLDVTTAAGVTTLEVSAPWFRRDLNIPEDIIEEIVRLYGLDRITPQNLTGILRVPEHEPELPLVWEIRKKLPVMGLTEVYNYSFYGEELMRAVGFDPKQEHIEILNPLSDEFRYLRVNLLPRMLENIVRNQQHQKQLALFEIGHVYFADREVRQLGIVVMQKTDAYRTVRGIAEQLLRELHVPYTTTLTNQTADCPFWNSYAEGRALRVNAGEAIAGTIAEIHPDVLKRMGIDMPVAFATLSIPVLHAHGGVAPKMKPISLYPAITLDLSIIVDAGLAWSSVESIVRQEAGELLQSLMVFDIFTGGKIPAGKKSISLRMVMQSRQRTLEMKEMEQWREQLMAVFNKQFGVQLRDK